MSERPALRAAKARLRDKFFRTKWLVAFIAVAILLFFGRVTNIRPLSQSALVIGVGIDLADDGFDVSALSVVVSGGNGTTPSETYVVTTAQGATVSEALDKISQKMGLLVSLSHCNVLVLSPRAFSVDHVRLFLPLVSSFSLPEQAAVTATESKPSDVLAARTATDASAFFVQASLLQNLGGDGIALVTVKDFLAASLSRSGSVNIPVIDIREPEHQPSGQSGGGEVKELVMGRNLVVHGGETFFLAEDLAQAATMLVRDKVKGRLSVTLRDGTAVELRVIDASPSLSADGMSVHASLSVTASFLEVQHAAGSSPVTPSDDIVRAAADQAARDLEHRLLACHALSLEHSADFLGIENEVYKHIGYTLPQNCLADIAFSCSATVTVKESG